MACKKALSVPHSSLFEDGGSVVKDRIDPCDLLKKSNSKSNDHNRRHTTAEQLSNRSCLLLFGNAPLNFVNCYLCVLFAPDFYQDLSCYFNQAQSLDQPSGTSWNREQG